MINAEIAKNNAQIRNRDKWLEVTLEAISGVIEEHSKAGLRSCSITVPLYIGAENLLEAGETLVTLAKKLALKGFTHYINEDGILVIEW